jgi:hypothetical protein
VLKRKGRRGLQELPGIGSHIAASIESLILTGEMPTRVETSVGC